MQVYSERINNGPRRTWKVERLWELSKDLPVEEVAIASISSFTQVTWFDDEDLPTCKAVTEHAKRILSADLSHPVILSQDGWVMDGMHRVARAYLEGREVIAVRKFQVNPDPDWED